MAKRSLDEKLRQACDTRIAEEGKINIYEEFENVVNEIGLTSEDAGGKITFEGADPHCKEYHRTRHGLLHLPYGKVSCRN